VADLSTADFLEPKSESQSEEKQHENHHHSNFKYENGDIAFKIERFIKTLSDISDNGEIHADGTDNKFSTPCDIKSCSYRVKNSIQQKKCKCNGRFIFYRTNHRELIEKNGSYIFVIYTYTPEFEGDESNICIHAIKKVKASQIDYLIKKSLSKEKIGISWSRLFKKIHTPALFEIPLEVDE